MSPPLPGNEALESAIAASPDDPAPYGVYADWLIEQGHPFGEFIALQLARAERPKDSGLALREQEMLGANVVGWLGVPLWKLKRAGGLSYEWRYGFFKGVTFGAPTLSDVDAESAYAGLANCHLFRFARELDVHLHAGKGLGRGGHFDETVAAMARHGVPATLARLSFDVADYQISWSHLGDVTPLYPALQNLVELSLHVGTMDLGPWVDLPRLERLAILTGGLGREAFEAVLASPFPELHSLSLGFGSADYGCRCTIDDVRRLLERATLPKLRHLGLRNAEFQDAIVDELARSPRLATLRTLDVSMGTMGDVGAQVLLEQAPAFAHLESIDVSENFITPPVAERLRATFRERILVAPQRSDGGHGRYCLVAE